MTSEALGCRYCKRKSRRGDKFLGTRTTIEEEQELQETTENRFPVAGNAGNVFVLCWQLQEFFLVAIFWGEIANLGWLTISQEVNPESDV